MRRTSGQKNYLRLQFNCLGYMSQNNHNTNENTPPQVARYSLELRKPFILWHHNNFFHVFVS